ncbi:hypothetical protein VN97_g372 [Penicillium thymicola]|uniref:Uncharacterized protein n=1 Tax=Penicillium thymicola TaxID=293382 RepID=A0AAI9TT05_PENTH|nr:hypothetical protein VN97_g372 [Penicillium thymicola]
MKRCDVSFFFLSFFFFFFLSLSPSLSLDLRFQPWSSPVINKIATSVLIFIPTSLFYVFYVVLGIFIEF